MVAALLFGIALLIGLILIGRWFIDAQPKQILRSARWVGVAVLVALTLFLALTGRLSWALGTALALLPLILRIIQAARTAKTYARSAGLGGQGQTSTVETAAVRMTLDHDSGVLDGEVIQGQFAGRRLSDLTTEAVIALLGECQDDAETRQVLEAFLDRRDPNWRAAASTSGDDGDRGDAGRGGDGVADGGGSMGRTEALAVLGLDAGADEAAIRAAHRRLIRQLHPDHGGSDWLAARINEARRVLLAGRR